MPNKKRNARYRSAGTGRYVSEKFAATHQETTVTERLPMSEPSGVLLISADPESCASFMRWSIGLQVKVREIQHLARPAIKMHYVIDLPAASDALRAINYAAEHSLDWELYIPEAGRY